VEHGYFVGREILSEILAEPFQGERDMASEAVEEACWTLQDSLPRKPAGPCGK
jgi:hypothetical protein